MPFIKGRYILPNTVCEFGDAPHGVLQGICKDCGNGTLNNNTNPAFDVASNDDGDEILVCNRCGSTHLDVL
jgi:ribosomal protein L32